jgi:pimeloyl-ACP methyl ester carboxylesterase
MFAFMPIGDHGLTDLPGNSRATTGTIAIVAASLIGLVTAAGAVAVAPLRAERAPSPLALRHLLGGPASAISAAGASAHLPVDAKPGVHFFKCKEAEGGRCGTMQVPLDRAHPDHGKVKLFFEYFHHRRKGPSREAILVSEGGPGYSVTQTSFEDTFYHAAFYPLLKTRDLILLDQRGVGRSDAIDCKAVQHDGDINSPHIMANVAACAKQLGFAASLYGSGNVALDMDAVRRRLGIAKLDLYGGSYAAQDVQSYAARFPQHVRSAVLDSPFVASAFDAHGSKFDDFATDLSRQGPRVANILCSRSRSCSSERGSVYGSIRWLANRLHKHPLDGTGLDADGQAHHVHVTEGFLGWNLLLSGDFNNTAASEIAAAADALKAGDRAPLLRLAAENSGGGGDAGNPKNFSQGDGFARFCTDNRFPWKKSSPPAERRRQYKRARHSVNPDQFGLFSPHGWLARSTSPVPDPCIVWPHPKHHVPPAMPRHGGLPGNVPALVITGDLDQSLPPGDSKPLTRLWPHSNYVKVLNAGHHTFFSRQDCAPGLAVHFIATLKPGDTSCAKDTSTLSFPAIGRFAKTAADARQGTVQAGSGDASTADDRKVATVATAAVTDAFRRGFIQSGPFKGPGLRGGTFKLSFGNSSATADLTKARFAKDVAVSGSADYGFASQAIDGTVTVFGPGAEDGALHITGVWFGYGVPTTVLKVEGTLGGRTVALKVPAS